MNVENFYKQLAPTPTQYLTTINGKRLWIKRDDLNDAEIQGNKLRKIKAILLKAEKSRLGLLSFGGAYSNHISALAAAGKRFKIATCGIIRGEELQNRERQSHTLKLAQANGMRLHCVSRSEYRDKARGQTVQAILQTENWWTIPEGGSDKLALLGASEIVDEIIDEVAINSNVSRPDKLFCACGTGGTLAGILQGVHNNQNRDFNCQVIGVAVLKGADFLYDDIRALNPQADAVNWDLILDAHGGGYAKVSAELLEFIATFEHDVQVPLEPIYTGKLVQAVFEKATQGDNSAEDWLIYHSGGLQGAGNCVNKF